MKTKCNCSTSGENEYPGHSDHVNMCYNEKYARSSVSVFNVSILQVCRVILEYWVTSMKTFSVSLFKVLCTLG